MGLHIAVICALVKTKKAPVKGAFCWRREEDSNLRTSFPSHTISNRAP